MSFSKDELNITNFEDDLEKIETNEFKEETVSVEDLESNHNKKRYRIFVYVMFRKGIIKKESAQQQQAGNIYTTIESNKLKLTDLILIQQVQCLNLSRKPKRIIIKNEATDFEKAEAFNDDLDPNENYKQEDDDFPPPKKKCIKKSASLKKKGMLLYVSLYI